MKEDMSFDEIMNEITTGLSGDPSADISYLQEKCEEYKEHAFSKEILRACGRLIYELIPDDKKEEFEKAFEKDVLSYDSTLEEIRFNIYKKDYAKALKMAEDLVAKIEELNMFADDQVSEYHVFDEPFEELLYRYRIRPEKELRQAQLPYTEIYGLYGSLLVEVEELEAAREALLKGLRWNPMSFEIMSEYIETFKMEGDLDTFYAKTLEAFKIAFRAPNVARCFRNLGYYFVEKQLYPEALGVYTLSGLYDADSKQMQSELHYIDQVSGGVQRPSLEEVKRFSEMYGFPTFADRDVIGIAYANGKHYFEEGSYEAARYFLGIAYDLTEDEAIKGMLDAIPIKEQ